MQLFDFCICVIQKLSVPLRRGLGITHNTRPG
nr:MAG TPA: hypothetical protein [Caudoviricetes sp.]